MNQSRAYFLEELVYRMAAMSLSRESVANYFGVTKIKFQEFTDEYPGLEEAYLMGMSAGMAMGSQCRHHYLQHLRDPELLKRSIYFSQIIDSFSDE